jgi:hypothetical protein
MKEAFKGSLTLFEAAQYHSFLPEHSESKATSNHKVYFRMPSAHLLRAVCRTDIRNIEALLLMSENISL